MLDTRRIDANLAQRGLRQRLVPGEILMARYRSGLAVSRGMPLDLPVVPLM